MSRLLAHLLGELAQARRLFAGQGCNIKHGLAVKAWLALCVAALLVPLPADAASESFSATSISTSARLKITVVIHPVVQILENSHPVSLTFAGEKASRTSAVQHVVLISNLRHGICMELHLAQTLVSAWHMRLRGHASVLVEELGDGYRLCVRHPGRHEMALEHEFMLKDASPQRARADTALDWPVYLSLATP